MSRLLRKLVSLGKRPFSPRRESDVEDDPAVAHMRETGGEPVRHDDDAGAGEYTGAEARSDDERQD